MQESIDPAGPPSAQLAVLVADDEALIRDLIARMLTGAGHRASAVADGDEALAALDEGGYDVAILDVRMPGASALEIAQRCRHRGGQRIPIIVLTAGAVPSASLDGSPPGVDAILTKPITRQELLDAVTRVVTGRLPSEATDRPRSASSGILDERKLEELCHHDSNGEFRRRFLTKFMVRAIDTVRSIELAVETGNAVRLDDLVHQLEGSAGTAGALAIESACAALGADAIAHRARARVADLKDAVREVARHLSEKYDIDVQG